uniref:Transmembrane protein 35A n=1 Tax=Hanusia phi TaxID=3032 RepID=A0A7S0NDN1_9CRYP
MFLMAGSNKVSPHINAEMHNHLSQAFPPMGKMWSGILRDFLTSVKQDQYHELIQKNLLDDGSGSYKLFMTNLGYVEVVCAILLLTPLSPLASFILFLIMMAATYTHHVIKEPIVVTVGLMVLFIIRALLPVQKPANKQANKKKRS